MARILPPPVVASEAVAAARQAIENAKAIGVMHRELMNTAATIIRVSQKLLRRYARP
jgi:hypothetical protein